MQGTVFQKAFVPLGVLLHLCCPKLIQKQLQESLEEMLGGKQSTRIINTRKECTIVIFSVIFSSILVTLLGDISGLYIVTLYIE